MRRGEVRWYTFEDPDRRRPVLILTRNGAIEFLSYVTIVPLTSTVRDVPSQVLLTPDNDGVRIDCVANCDNIMTIRKSDINSLITLLTPERMREIDRAVCIALDMDYLLYD